MLSFSSCMSSLIALHSPESNSILEKKPHFYFHKISRISLLTLTDKINHIVLTRILLRLELFA